MLEEHFFLLTRRLTSTNPTAVFYVSMVCILLLFFVPGITSHAKEALNPLVPQENMISVHDAISSYNGCLRAYLLNLEEISDPILDTQRAVDNCTSDYQRINDVLIEARVDAGYREGFLRQTKNKSIRQALFLAMQRASNKRPHSSKEN